MSNFMKIRSVGAELFHADGRTDRQRDVTKLILVFSNFAKASKIQHRLWLYQKHSSLDHYHLFPKPKQNTGSHGFKDDRHIEAAVTATAGNTGHW